MKISVIMAVFNEEKFVADAIESILGQTFTDFEFIIIDDFSNDGTPKILSKYALKDRRIILFKNSENLGLTKSLNIGLKLAKTNFIARMDGDDISCPERFERQYDYMLSNPVCKILATEGTMIDVNGNKIKRIRINMKGYDQLTYLLNYGSPFVHSSILFNKRAIAELGGYDEALKSRQDIDLWLRAVSYGYRIDFLKENLVKFRLHPQSVSNKNVDQILCLNVAVRMLFLAKSENIALTLENALSIAERDPLVKRYISSVKTRKQIKMLIGQLKSFRFKAILKTLKECLASFPFYLRQEKLLPLAELLLQKRLDRY